MEMRPIERRVRRLHEAGLSPGEIAWRLRRSPRFVRNVLAWSERPRSPRVDVATERLRPLERRVLAWRSAGASHAEIAARFRRSPDFIRRVETLALHRREQLERRSTAR